MKASTKAGAATLVLTLTGALVLGTRTPTVSSLTHVSFAFESGAPAGTECLWTTAQATPEALGLFGLQADAGPQYVLVRTCAPPVEDAGDGPALPAGMFPLSVTERTETYDGGQPEFEAWTAADPDVPWDCACSPGSGCYVPEDDGGTREAPVGSTLQPGWSGACVTKACGVFSTEDGSDPTWPAGCPR